MELPAVEVPRVPPEHTASLTLPLAALNLLPDCRLGFWSSTAFVPATRVGFAAQLRGAVTRTHPLQMAKGETSAAAEASASARLLRGTRAFTVRATPWRSRRASQSQRTPRTPREALAASTAKDALDAAHPEGGVGPRCTSLSRLAESPAALEETASTPSLLALIRPTFGGWSSSSLTAPSEPPSGRGATLMQVEFDRSLLPNGPESVLPSVAVGGERAVRAEALLLPSASRKLRAAWAFNILVRPA